MELEPKRALAGVLLLQILLSPIFFFGLVLALVMMYGYQIGGVWSLMVAAFSSGLAAAAMLVAVLSARPVFVGLVYAVPAAAMIYELTILPWAVMLALGWWMGTALLAHVVRHTFSGLAGYSMRDFLPRFRLPPP